MQAIVKPLTEYELHFAGTSEFEPKRALIRLKHLSKTVGWIIFFDDELMTTDRRNNDEIIMYQSISSLPMILDLLRSEDELFLHYHRGCAYLANTETEPMDDPLHPPA